MGPRSRNGAFHALRRHPIPFLAISYIGKILKTRLYGKSPNLFIFSVLKSTLANFQVIQLRRGFPRGLCWVPYRARPQVADRGTPTRDGGYRVVPGADQNQQEEEWSEGPPHSIRREPGEKFAGKLSKSVKHFEFSITLLVLKNFVATYSKCDSHTFAA